MTNLFTTNLDKRINNLTQFKSNAYALYLNNESKGWRVDLSSHLNSLLP